MNQNEITLDNVIGRCNGQLTTDNTTSLMKWKRWTEEDELDANQIL